MQNPFKEDKQTRPPDAKGVRDAVLRFLKDQLQKVEGGEGGNIRGIYLFINPSAEEKHLYDAAFYADDEQRFKNEIQKIADDFVIDLPDAWVLETRAAEAPLEAVKIPGLDAAVFIQTRKKRLQKSATARIRVLNGEAEKEEYTISSTDSKLTIGRERQVQTDDGFFRLNGIAFPGISKHESNRYVSRQHAHIEWDEETGTFLLFADEGGVPPKNKIKVKSLRGNLVKLQNTAVPHPLADGDQIVLGETALLEFSLVKKEAGD